MRFRTQSMLAVGVAVAALAVPLTIQTVGAQDAPQNPPPGQGGAFAGPRDGQRPGQFPGQPGQFPGQPGPMPQMMMMGGGSPTMVVDGAFLYILRGNQLIKVQKETLKVVAQGELPMPEMRGPGGPDAQPLRRGGLGGNPPPPSE